MTQKRELQKRATDENTLPHNLEAERSVIGAILTHNDAFDEINETVTPGHFYRDAHQRIYAAMCRLLGERKSVVDLLTLKEELGRVGDLDAVGGTAYVAALVDGVPRSVNVKYYANIVQEKHQLRGIILAANRALSQAYEAKQSPTEILQAADRAFLELENGGANRMRHIGGLVPALWKRIEYRVEHKGELTGVDTGFPSISEITLGWQRGDLNIFGARPSIGKTAFVVNSMLNAALGPHKTRIAYFSLEMTDVQILDRIVARLSGVDAMKIRSGHLSELDLRFVSKAMSTMEEIPIYIDDRVGLTVPEIRAACRRLKAEGGLDLVTVDYGQLIKGSLDRRGTNRNEEMTDIATRLKDLAGELNVPVNLLSQLSRANDKRPDPRPKLSDLRESGALEQVAALVAFLHRRDHREGGTTQFILAKQRNGPTGSVNLTFDRDLQTFLEGGENIPEPEPEPKKMKGKKQRALPAAPDPRLPVDAD